MNEPTAETQADSDAVRPAAWAVVAAFGTYFCMYGFRKPYTAADYADSSFWGFDFKTILVVTQVAGYTLSKFIGIKVVSEMPPHRRAIGIVVLIATAWASLAVFGLLPRPWNTIGLFVNGLSLGVVFGLVLGFLEGRQLTEALVAGLCASFILAGGVTKTVGAWLLASGVPEDWMPFAAGGVYIVPFAVSVFLLSRVRPPTANDMAERTERFTMTRSERWALYRRYAPGLTAIVAVYLMATVIRSLWDDFAPELWSGLGEPAEPGTFATSVLWVAIGVLVVNALAVRVRDNRAAFHVSLLTCGAGLVVLSGALIAHSVGAVSAFPFMVLVGFGLYLPYVAIHTTVFERMLAMTRERGNLGFLMYVADAFGYLAYVGVLIARNVAKEPAGFLPLFVVLCWTAVVLSTACLVVTWRYFAVRTPQREVNVMSEPILAEEAVS